MGTISKIFHKLAPGELFKKAHLSGIEELLSEYQDLVHKCADAYKNTMTEYLIQGKITAEYERKERITHRFESEADDKRKTLEFKMYSSNLVPQSRGDILGLTESLDKIANQMEHAVQIIFIHNVEIPRDLFPRVEELVNVNHETAILAVDLFRDFCKARKDLHLKVKKIDDLESKSDFISRSMAVALFRRSDISDLQKILLDQMVYSISRISNKAEKFADRINIVSVKRMY